MEEIRDRRWIAEQVAASGIRDYFDSEELEFQAYRYARGEIIASPDAPLQHLLFLVKGAVQIYGIRSDGGISPINYMTPPGMLGDVEYCNGLSPFFVEVKEEAVCLALDVRRYREALDRDLAFLHHLLRSFAEKLEHFSLEETLSFTVEERVLFYLSNIAPDHEIRGIETALLRLRCSRRQLQRVLRQLCDEGKIKKTGHGSYRLAGYL